MNKYILSDELEISVIEHRLLQIYFICEKSAVEFFYPGIIFNESFWRLERQKRYAILTTDALFGWLDTEGTHLTKLYLDGEYLEIIKTLKLIYQPNTKVSLVEFVELLTKEGKKQKKFYSFGDINNSPLIFINKLVASLTKNNRSLENTTQVAPEKQNTKVLFYRNNVYSELIGKSFALDIYAKYEQTELVQDVLFFLNHDSSEIFLDILRAFKKIFTDNPKQLENVCKFYIVHEKHFNISNYEEKINNVFPKGENELWTFAEVEDFIDLKPTIDLDYILCIDVLSNLPSEIIYKSTTDYYLLKGRVVVKTNPDVNKEQLLEKLSSPNKFSQTYTKEELDMLDLEVVYVQNSQKILSVMPAQELPYKDDNSYARFSPGKLAFLIKLLKALKPNGTFHLIDLEENIFNSKKLEFPKNSLGFYENFINFEYYIHNLNVFSDLNFNYFYKGLNESLSTILYEKENYLYSNKALKFAIEENKKFFGDLFAIKNLEKNVELTKILKKLRKYSFLKNQKIPFLGLGSLIYKYGFGRLKKKLANVYPENKVFVDMRFMNSKSYNKEILLNIINYFYDNAIEDKSYFAVDLNPKLSKRVVTTCNNTSINPSGVVKTMEKFKTELKAKEKKYNPFFYSIITNTS